MLRRTLSILTLALASLTAQATHMSGGEIYWECLGNNNYRIRLLVYRDCAGISVDPNYTLDITSPCGNRTLTVSTNGGTELSQLCDLELPNSTCNGGTLPGIQQYIYTGTVNLPPCNAWRISWTNIYRNDAIVNLTAPGTRQMFIEAVMNNSTGPCNDSPTFTNAAIPYVCLGYPISYSYGAVDSEADSLSYSLIGARMLNGNPIPYIAPFSPVQPITGLILDPATGLLNFTLSIAGNWVVVVLVTEYDANGNVIGRVMRDMQFVAFPCSNVPPDAATGLVENISGTATQTGPRAVSLCESGNVCFDMEIVDANANNVLTATSNVLQNLPAATFSYTGTNPITAHVCWTAQPGTAGFFPFIVTVSDGACPIPAFQTYVYTVRVIPGLAAYLEVVNESCLGNGDGSVEAVITTGTGPFSYTWSTGSSEAMVFGDPGDYSVEITDENGCTSPVLSGAITSGPAAPLATAGPDLHGCQGAVGIPLSGNVTNAAGGAWGNGGGTIGGTWPNNTYTPTSAEFAAGGVDLVLTATGNGTCPPATDTLHIALTNSFAGVTLDATDALCNGGSTGSAEVVPNVSTFSYAWSDPAAQTSAIASLLSAGPVTVVVSDGLGCDTTLTTVIGQPVAISIASLVATNEACSGTGDGTLTATGAGGTAPYTYTWSNGATGSILTAGSGTYTVSVSDANGCSPASEAGTISATGQPNEANAGIDLVGCLNEFPIQVTGSVQNATGGSWSGGSGVIMGTGLTIQYAPTVNEISTGSVSLVLTTSGNGSCPPATDTVSISLSNAFLNAQMSVTDALCNGSTDGTITFTPNNAQLTYLWNDPLAQTTASATGLSAGAYSLLVTDVLGCDSSFSATITDPSLLFIDMVVPTPVVCVGGSTGAASLQIQGGSPNYTIVWSNGQTGNQATGLSAGNYTVDVTDANGCSAQAATTITEPDPIVVVVQTPDTVCANVPVQLIAMASGGAGDYTFNWGGMGYNDTVQLAFSAAQTILLNVVDGAGCLGPTTPVSIAVRDLNTATLNTYGDTTVCFGGSGTVGASLTGYTGNYTMVWSPIGNVGPGPHTVPISTDQVLTVTVSDECGQTISNTVGLGVDIVPEIVLPPILAEGCALLTVQYPTLNLGNVTYHWNLGNGNTSNMPAPVVTYPAGNYVASLSVTTPLGCMAQSSGGGVIHSYANPTAQFDASPWITNIDAPIIDFTDQSAGAITSYSWIFGEGGTSSVQNPSHNFMDVGTFDVELTVTDTNGCSSSVDHPITISPVYDVEIPTAFTPSTDGPGSGQYVTGDLSNDVFYPFVRFVTNFRMRIFNRWGELIFESTDLKVGWDGYYRGELSPQDVYVVQTWYKFVDGKQIEKLSDLTLFR